MDECLDAGNAGNDTLTSSILVLRYTSSDEAGCSTWGEWGSWGGYREIFKTPQTVKADFFSFLGSCSQSCGSGVQQRNRTCAPARDEQGHVITVDPLRGQCQGRATLTRPCFTKVCQSEDIIGLYSFR